MSAEPQIIVVPDESPEHGEQTPEGASGAADSAAAAPPAVASDADAGATGGSSSDDMECPICLQTCIHPARLPCGHVFCFLCVKGVAYKNRRCAMCRREIPLEFLDHPHLLFKIDENTPATEDGYQWFYEGRNGWWQYDERTSQDIEEAYKRADKFCTIMVAGYVYIVDFETMLQLRQNEPSRKRQVKRDLATIAKKGVAGLRIDGTADPQESALSSSSLMGGTAAGATSSFGGESLRYVAHRSPLPALVANNLISTIAATDAAIRIASDIIDSTLAHASNDSPSSSFDYRPLRSRYRTRSPNGSHSPLSSSSSSSSAGAVASISSRQDLLNEVQEALNISASSAHDTDADASTLAAPRLDFFTQTIDEFRSLALSNIAESSADSDSDDDGNPMSLPERRTSVHRRANGGRSATGSTSGSPLASGGTTELF